MPAAEHGLMRGEICREDEMDKVMASEIVCMDGGNCLRLALISDVFSYMFSTSLSIAPSTRAPLVISYYQSRRAVSITPDASKVGTRWQPLMASMRKVYVLYIQPLVVNKSKPYDFSPRFAIKGIAVGHALITPRQMARIIRRLTLRRLFL